MELSKTLLLAIHHYLEDVASEQERAMVEEWYYSTDETAEIPAEIMGKRIEVKERMWQRLQQGIRGQDTVIEKQPVIPIYRKKWIAAAVVMGLLLGAALLYYQFNSPMKKQPIAVTDPSPAGAILPGGNKATLTLSDGSVILLDSARNGRLADQGSTTVLKVGDGQLAYDAVEEGSATVFNTLSTPRGGQYTVTLPDGTKVWLNAQSSLRFPTHFTGNQRQVELTGEGYFEVVHNTQQPFVVHTGNVTVHDIGTAFNINSYADEPALAVTLTEGSARVVAGQQQMLLQPGEQAMVQASTIHKSNADVAEDLAWKEGKFYFKAATIEEVMRQVSRWYDIEVVYTGKITERFTGAIYRDAKVSEVFTILQQSASVHFSVESRKIIVSP